MILKYFLYIFKEYKFSVISFIFLFLVSIPSLRSGATLTLDSSAFLDSSILVPPGYPLFLSLFRLFGEFQLFYIAFFQLLLNLLFGLIFISYILKILKLHNIYILTFLPIGFYLLIVSPNNYVYAFSIMTEAISLPIFLICSYCIIKSIYEDKSKYLLYAIFINAILIIIRSQFIVLIPIFGLLIIYFYYSSNTNIKPVYFIVCLFLSVTFSSLFVKTHNLIKHNDFRSVSMLDMAMLSQVIYLANPDYDYNVNSDENRILLNSMLESAFENQSLRINFISSSEYSLNEINSLQVSSNSTNPYGLTNNVIHYHDNFNSILYRSVRRTLVNHYSYIESELERWDLINSKSSELYRSLMQYYLIDMFKFRVLDIITHGYSSHYSFIVFIILLFSASINLLLNPKSKLNIILLSFLLFHIGSQIAPAFGGRVLFRYYIYSHFVISTLFIVSVFKIFSYSDMNHLISNKIDKLN